MWKRTEYLHSGFEFISVHTLTLVLLVHLGHRCSVGQQVVVLGLVLWVQLDSRLEQRIQQEFCRRTRELEKTCVLWHQTATYP